MLRMIHVSRAVVAQLRPSRPILFPAGCGTMMPAPCPPLRRLPRKTTVSAPVPAVGGPSVRPASPPTTASHRKQNKTIGRPLLHGRCCTGRPPMRCTGKVEQSCRQGYVPSVRSHWPPNIGLVGSGVCEKKYRFVVSCVRCCPPLSPERVNVESGFWWPRPE